MRGEKLPKQIIRDVVSEMESGLVGADLGGGLYKKRIALQGRGKRDGYRVLLAFKECDHIFVVYGYAKNRQSNINKKEKETYRELAKILLAASEQELQRLLKIKKIIEVI